jgi:hypothetical protein
MNPMARILVLLALAATVACSKAPLKVTTVQLGKTLNSDNSVGTHATTFKPRDTVFASVLTDAGGKGTIETKWYYGSSKVSEMKKPPSGFVAFASGM